MVWLLTIVDTSYEGRRVLGFIGAVAVGIVFAWWVRRSLRDRFGLRD
jgi:hypothetical protein